MKERGFRFLAHDGKYILVSIVRDSITLSDPEFHKREATLLGGRNATVEDFRTVMSTRSWSSPPVLASQAG